MIWCMKGATIGVLLSSILDFCAICEKENTIGIEFVILCVLIIICICLCINVYKEL